MTEEQEVNIHCAFQGKWQGVEASRGYMVESKKGLDPLFWSRKQDLEIRAVIWLKCALFVIHKTATTRICNSYQKKKKKKEWASCLQCADELRDFTDFCQTHLNQPLGLGMLFPLKIILDGLYLFFLLTLHVRVCFPLRSQRLLCTVMIFYCSPAENPQMSSHCPLSSDDHDLCISVFPLLRWGRSRQKYAMGSIIIKTNKHSVKEDSFDSFHPCPGPLTKCAESLPQHAESFYFCSRPKASSLQY